MDCYIKRNDQVKNQQGNLYVMYKFDMLKQLVDIKCIVDNSKSYYRIDSRRLYYIIISFIVLAL